MKARVVSATRLSERAFWNQSLLGRSLRLFPEEMRPELALTFDNDGARARGLPSIYNEAIESCPGGRALVFVHDDVFLHDPLLESHLGIALERVDVVGVAGSSGARDDAVSWGLHFDQRMKYAGWMRGPAFEHVQLSGAVSHRRSSTLAGLESVPALQLGSYGPVPARCTLLDGVLLAARASTLQSAEVRFDERFSFHLYDLDFCRSATRAQLRLSTWPLLLTHGSAGAFGTAEWCDAARQYRRKWAALSPPETP
jgi:GT2 family glycosyltransferase